MAARMPSNAPWIALLVGALLVALALIGWTAWSASRLAQAARDVKIDVDVPKPRIPDVPTPDPQPSATSPGAEAATAPPA
ncbi:hypothetical protein [Caulobacter sp. 17J80-11]|uniref:hypothetical protein n=1 Tax=Caulobacter sp. 17J80-11 TaxID=2763502 RepID=UPI001653E86F|nr:hypothetical protein [Caulobacter sp. 17J80-11]MBC6983078.1 hypothetical protein [Caulobacter sp. 17J80-11]